MSTLVMCLAYSLRNVLIAGSKQRHTVKIYHTILILVCADIPYWVGGRDPEVVFPM